MSMLLIKYQADYSDEFDVYGFRVVEESEWEKELEEIKEYFEEYGPQERGFGTNEAIEYETFDSYKKCFTCSTISEEEAKVLIKLFPNCSYGYGHFLTIYCEDE